MFFRRVEQGLRIARQEALDTAYAAPLAVSSCPPTEDSINPVTFSAVGLDTAGPTEHSPSNGPHIEAAPKLAEPGDAGGLGRGSERENTNAKTMVRPHPARSTTSVPPHGFLDLAVLKPLTDSKRAVEGRRITDEAMASREGPSNCRVNWATDEAWYTEIRVAAGT